MDLNERVGSYRKDMIEKLCELIAIPSLQAPALPGKPFGAPCYEALEYTLDLARKLGFTKVENVDGYAGFAEAGEGEEEIGVFVHLDVVPAGEGWTREPFKGTVEADRIYGRGTMDDKGPCIASLYALKALVDTGAQFKKRLRIIFGCNEESGMGGLKYYAKARKMPDYAFTPDGGYPIINVEMGILNLTFTKKCEKSAEGKGIRVKSVKAGERANIVPSIATAGLLIEDAGEFKKAFDKFVSDTGYRMSCEIKGSVAEIRSDGVGAHGSTPDRGQNAAGQVLMLLKFLPLAGGDVENALLAIADKIGMTNHAEKLGADFKDEYGRLSCNLGILEANEGEVTFTVDIRHPVSKTHEEVTGAVTNGLKGTGFTMEITGEAPNHCVPADHPLVKKLLEVYAQQTGNEPYCTAVGGGTYARMLPNRAVAFGIEFPGKPMTAHMADEYIMLDEYFKDAEIIANAMKALACEPW